MAIRTFIPNGLAENEVHRKINGQKGKYLVKEGGGSTGVHYVATFLKA